jgi:hypothetical protein
VRQIEGERKLNVGLASPTRLPGCGQRATLMNPEAAPADTVALRWGTPVFYRARRVLMHIGEIPY